MPGMMRRKLLFGNWKMNRSPHEADALAQELKSRLANTTHADIGVAPTFLALPAVISRLKHTPIEVGAQNLHAEASGAFTGEVSGEMLKSAGCVWCIVGHSERRQIFGETDAMVLAKVQACYRAGLKPILCVGETLAERDGGQAEAVVRRQVAAVVGKLSPDQVLSLTIAYEPVWAIGTGRTATPTQAQDMHAVIRELLTELAPPPHKNSIPRSVRILYGGSVKASNAATLLSQPDIDGALIGGASLVVDEFVAIIQAAAER